MSIHPVKLAPLDAVHAVQAHPHQWSRDPATFADPPEGHVGAGGNGGGIGRLAGASARAD